jgi:O-antigen/teichoic acid export membrane protein
MTGRFARWLPRSAFWKDVSWAASGSAAAQALSVAMIPVLTRLYAPADFASLNIFTQFVAGAAVLVTWRYEYAIQLPRDDVRAHAVLRLVLALALIGSLLMTPLAFWLAPHAAAWLGEPGLAVGLPLVPLTAALTSASLAVQHVSQRQLRYRRAGAAEVAGKLAYFATALIGRLWSSGGMGLLLAVGAGAVGKTAFLLESRKDGPAQRSSARHTWHRLVRRMARRYLRLSLSWVASHLLFTVTGLLPTLYIARTYGAATLGQYALVLSTTYLPSSFVGAAIGQVYYQRAAALWSQGAGFGELWRQTTSRLVRLGLPVYLGLAALSPWLYPLLFGQQWKPAGLYSSIMCISSFFAFLTTPLDRSCIVVGAWRYVPLWHLLRLASTAAVIALAWYADWPVLVFLFALSLQMTAMYLVDMAAERRFSMRTPPPLSAIPAPSGA